MPPNEIPIDLAIRQIVATQFNVDIETITRATRFVEDLFADSLDHVEILVALDDFTSRTIRNTEMEFRTVGELIDFFEDDDEGGAGIPARLKRPPDSDAGHAA